MRLKPKNLAHPVRIELINNEVLVLFIKLSTAQGLWYEAPSEIKIH